MSYAFCGTYSLEWLLVGLGIDGTVGGVLARIAFPWVVAAEWSMLSTLRPRDGSYIASLDPRIALTCCISQLRHASHVAQMQPTLMVSV